MSEMRFNYVVIFDSIPTGELNIAKKLHEDLEMLANAYPSRPGIAYRRIKNKSELFDCLEELRIHSEQNDMSPLLHIESHGGKDGLYLADGSLVSWQDLKKGLIPLNISLKLNLLVILASCYGGALASALDATDRAPVWGLIGAKKKISVGEVEERFGFFYRTLFSEGCPKAAINAFIESSPSDLYYRVTAEGFFYTIWQNYKKNHCSPKNLKMRAREMRKKAKKKKVTPLPSAAEIKKDLVRNEPDAFKKFRDIYFMNDLYPENKERFQVTYEKAKMFKPPKT